MKVETCKVLHFDTRDMLLMLHFCMMIFSFPIWVKTVWQNNPKFTNYVSYVETAFLLKPFSSQL